MAHQFDLNLGPGTAKREEAMRELADFLGNPEDNGKPGDRPDAGLLRERVLELEATLRGVRRMLETPVCGFADVIGVIDGALKG